MILPGLARRDLLRLGASSLGSIPLLARAQSEGTPQAGSSLLSSNPWPAFFAAQRLWAYADRLSIEPGDCFNVMVSTGPGQPMRRVRLEFYRIGAQEPDRLVWASEFATVGYHGATASGAALGPGWPAAFLSIDTSAWPPGVYSADIVEQTTGTRDLRALQLILRNPQRSAAVLCKLGTNTWQAYNDWGGHSLYPNGDDIRRGLIVSFDRPTPPAFFEYDVFIVRWLESLLPVIGIVDYVSNFDVHAGESILRPYKLVITSAHDEYWSKEEFDFFYRRIFAFGQNTCFFGGNTAYCQIRYSDVNAPESATKQGRQLICYKTATDPIMERVHASERPLLSTNNFREHARRPESMLLGGAYQGWFDPTSGQEPAYTVVNDQHPWFAGTGLQKGDVAANVVGYEWDNRDPEANGRRLWDATLSHIQDLDPRSVQVLMQGEPVDALGRRGLAEATWYRSPAGAVVFNAGSVRWGWGLTKPGYARAGFRKFNENMVRELML